MRPLLPVLLTLVLTLCACSEEPSSAVDATILADSTTADTTPMTMDAGAGDLAPADGPLDDSEVPQVGWQKVTTSAPQPMPLFAHTMAYDTKSSQVLVVGGRTGIGLEAELWQLQASQWTEMTPSSNPFPPRMSHGSAFDSKRGRLVVFGGLIQLGPPYPNGEDTWEWDGAQWLEAKPAKSPASRGGHAMAYDAAREVVVLFGGTNNVTELGDTWTWDGTTWTEVNPPNAPSPRFNTRMAYDAKRQRVVLFGGHTMTKNLADTWEWDGSTWAEVTPAQGNPPACGFHAMTYVADEERVVLFGGTDTLPPFTGGMMFSDLWAWDGVQWAKISAAGPAPEGRVGLGLTYDQKGKRLLLYGGSNSTELLGDLWQLTWK